jgi:dTDP-4-amino-4,6-dideoxygalactose transaminase
MTAPIPFLDLAAAHSDLRTELVSVFEAALDSSHFIGGHVVQMFEEDFATFCTSAFCVGVSSGTDALRFALIASGIRPGDTVITVPMTFIATAEAISQAGARPDFVDIDAGTYTMDPAHLRDYLENRCTRDPSTGRVVSRRTGTAVSAVVPVHLYGQVADMDRISEIADEFGLTIVEDACQAHGAEYFSRRDNRWRTAGSIGRAAAFSFYPGKNLGACGEGGAVTTNDPDVAHYCRLLRDHGQSKKYHHDIEGYNGRLDAIQAGILSVKLRHLAKWNDQRRENARRYSDLFTIPEASLKLPPEPSWSRAVYHLYVVQVANRDALQAKLAADGIGMGIHYPVPLHLLTAYAGLGFQRGDFPVAESLGSRALSLPMFPSLNEDQQRVVVTAIERHIG